MPVEETARRALAELVERLEELEIGVELAAGVERLPLMLQGDAMEADAAEFAVAGAAGQPVLVDQLADEFDGAQFRQERCVEGELAHSVDDLARRRRRLGALARVDLDEQHVLGRTRAQERTDRRITAVAAVPIRHAGDLDRAEKKWETGRSHDHFRADLGVGEHPKFPGANIGCRNE
jgi:hypothetical protein